MMNLQKVALLAVLMFVSSASAQTSHPLRALLVGVADYRHADGVAFRDLKGPVNDVAALREVLTDRYGLSPARTTVLIDEKATRRAILAELRKTLVDDAIPGEIALFYFAGHGSRVYDHSMDETSQKDDTILSHDARAPDGSVPDITDDELGMIVEMARAKGVRPVVILDSCHSGTGIRLWAQPRSAPHILHGSPKTAGLYTPQHVRNIADGSAILLAAAQDTEEALESERDGIVLGEFTRALVSVLKGAQGDLTYLDLLTQVQVALASRGVPHRPQGEGDLQQLFLGAAPLGKPPVYAEPSGPNTVRLHAGAASNVTLGSQYRLFRTAAAAARGDPILAVGKITTVRASSADLTLPDSAQRPSPLFAVESAHAFGDMRLKVAVVGGSVAQQAIVRKALQRLEYVELVAQDIATHWLEVSKTGLQLRRSDGSPVGANRSLSTNIDTELAAQLGRIAHYQAVLSLINPTRRLSPIRVHPVLATSESGPVKNPVMRDGEAVLALDQTYKLNIFNSGAEPLHIYVLNLDASYCVRLLVPPRNGEDEPLRGFFQTKLLKGPGRAGREHFLVLASKAPVDLQALEQPCLDAEKIRSAPISAPSFNDPLSQLLGNAGSARRGSNPELPLDGWSTSFLTISFK